MIAYASHVLTRAERKWSTYDRELRAIVWAVRHFRHYLYKPPFVIVTDHKPLLGLYPLTMTELVVVHVGLLNLILLNGL